MTFVPFLKGFGLGASLIIAIGSQNAFVLRQGLKKEYAFQTATICFLCDAILITLGVLGMAELVKKYQSLSSIIAVLGALFLFVYGLIALKSAFTSSKLSVDSSSPSKNNLLKILLIALSLSLLNPHVYLDTVMLLGSIGAQYSSSAERLLYIAGAVLASLVWFYGLVIGAHYLQGIFSKPLSWKVLDFLIAMTMWLIAFTLIKPIIF